MANLKAQPKVQPKVQQEYFSYEDAATFCGVSARSIRQWVYSKQVEVSRAGYKLVRIKRSELERFMAKCAIPSRESDDRVA